MLQDEVDEKKGVCVSIYTLECKMTVKQNSKVIFGKVCTEM